MLVLVLFCYVGLTYAFDEAYVEEARDKLAEAFEAVAEAERMGGDVSDLVVWLNEAVKLIEEGEACGNESLIGEAFLKAEAVIAEAPVLGEEGAASVRMRMIQNGVVLGVVVVLAVVVWRYGSRVFWRLWVKSKRDWRVKTC